MSELIEFKHISVLLDEILAHINPNLKGLYVDATLGGAGHAYEILKSRPDLNLLGIDRDIDAIDASKKKLGTLQNKIYLENAKSSEIKRLMSKNNLEKIDFFLMDLGVSSFQFDEKSRGFSYRFDSKLDMRMSKNDKFSAFDLVNTYSKEDLNRIIFENSDERWAKRIAGFIVSEREKKQIESSFELVEIIKKAIPLSARKDGPHPAKRTFQAIRMEVNQELKEAELAISEASSMLSKNAKLAIITFHSIEDRLVKNLFRKLSKPCTCPSDFPICICGKKTEFKIVNKKAISASSRELELNPRSKSAKLRILKRIEV